MRHAIRVLLALALICGVVGSVGVATADPVHASTGYTIHGSVYAAPAPTRPLDEVVVGLYQSNGAGAWNRINWTVPLNGEYEFNDVPEGDYRIGAEAPTTVSSPLWRYPLPVFWNNSASTVESATTLHLTGEVWLSPIAVLENARVTGTLRSAVDSEPLSGAAVTLYWFSGPGAYRTDTVATGPLGEYAIYVPRGDANSFSLRFAKPGYRTEYYVDQSRLEDAELRAAISWDGLDGELRANITAAVVPSARTIRRSGTVRFATTLRDGRTGATMANTRFRLQRSYNNRTWANVGGELKTGSTGRFTSSLLVNRTTYFRAVPVSSSTFYGVASPSVKIIRR